MNFIRQSFDHPSHALIPGMKIGWDLKTDLNRQLTSWKNSDDPSLGEYKYGFDPYGIPPQLFIWRSDSKRYRKGPWNGKNFGGLVFQTSLPFSTKTEMDATDVYYEHHLLVNSTLMLVTIYYTGNFIVKQSDSTKKNKIWIVAVVVGTSVLLICLASIAIWKRKSKKKGIRGTGIDNETFELPYFDIVTVTRATQDYSILNKIGQGGFGPVYKGILDSGEEIAVKRLSESSNQGVDEFKKEVMLIWSGFLVAAFMETTECLYTTTCQMGAWTHIYLVCS